MTPSRRAFLRGAGAALALPFLPSLARGATPAEPSRLVFVMWENGAPMERFTPTVQGRDWVATPLLAPLERHRDDMLIVSGVSNAPAAAWQGGGHSEAFASWLTAQPLRPTVRMGNDISVDQAAVPLVGAGRVLPSLQASLERGGTGGTCPAQMPCAYDVAISWAGPGQPLPPVDDPQLLFDRLFPATREARAIARRKSLLDLVREDAKALESRLDGEDRARLDEWFTGVRHLEKRLDAANASCGVDAPGVPTTDEEHAALVFDLIAAGLSCDAVRVVTLTLGRAASERRLPGHGNYDHHSASHHGNDPTTYDIWTSYTQWCIEQIGVLVDRLAGIDVGGGRLLDHSLVVAGSCLSEGARHVVYNLPLMTFGSLGGRIATGEHRKIGRDRPTADVWLGLLHTLGDTRPTFGEDGTDPADLA